jgi:hypothetical protein
VYVYHIAPMLMQQAQLYIPIYPNVFYLPPLEKRLVKAPACLMMSCAVLGLGPTARSLSRSKGLQGCCPSHSEPQEQQQEQKQTQQQKQS